MLSRSSAKYSFPWVSRVVVATTLTIAERFSRSACSALAMSGYCTFTATRVPSCSFARCT